MPAFVLGNGPWLPVDDLDCLAERFTIGVNRIFQAPARFRPTVLLWVDGDCYRKHAEEMDNCGSLMICDRSVRRRQYHVGLETCIGAAALQKESLPERLCCNGNTGCCAARWAAALGCDPVYLVGMSARYRDGRTDFYGDNPRHHLAEVGCTSSTLALMRRELDRLMLDLGPVIVPVPDGELLRDFAGECEPVDQEAVKATIRSALATRGVEVI